ncbi:MAG TPA: acetyltransferase [Paenibacillus sp.]|nr:acetyltransferase [Paenibacillus sp.]
MRDIIVIGGGRHAGVVIDMLQSTGRRVIGYTEHDPVGKAEIYGVPCIGDDESIEAGFSNDEFELCLGIGAVGVTKHRQRIFDVFTQRGYRFHTVLHPSCTISRQSLILDGVQVMAGGIVQSGVSLLENVLVNTRASIDHDCELGPHSVVSPGAVLCGGVKVGDNAFIGAGATIIQNVTIGSRACVGAGALVLSDVPDGAVVVGVPAKRIK